MALFVLNWCGYFLGNVWRKLGYFYSNIWSHCTACICFCTKKRKRKSVGVMVSVWPYLAIYWTFWVTFLDFWSRCMVLSCIIEKSLQKIQFKDNKLNELVFQVVLITGETGSGKTTQVPQYILVSQPLKTSEIGSYTCG